MMWYILPKPPIHTMSVFQAGYKYDWHYYVLTWDGSEVTIYMDITVVKKVSLAGNIMRNFAYLRPFQRNLNVFI